MPRARQVASRESSEYFRERLCGQRRWLRTGNACVSYFLLYANNNICIDASAQVCARTCDEDTAEEGFGTVCELVLPLRLFVRMKRHEGDVDQHQSAHQQVEAHGPHYLCVHVECVRHVCISGRHDPKPTQALPQRAHAGEDGRRGQYRTPKEVGGDVRVRGE